MRSWPIFLDLEPLRIYMAVLVLDADFALLQVSIQMYKCFGNQDLNIRNCRQLFIFSLSTLQIIIHVIKLSCNVLLFSNLGKSRGQFETVAWRVWILLPAAGISFLCSISYIFQPRVSNKIQIGIFWFFNTTVLWNNVFIESINCYEKISWNIL